MLASEFASKKKIVLFPFLAFVLALSSSSARAQAPNVVADAQQVLGSGFTVAPSGPQSIAISSNATVYVADTDNNQVVILSNSLPDSGIMSPVSTGAVTPALSKPQALAVDANGDLFIGDMPAGGGRIIELMGDGSGNLNGNAQVVYAGSILTEPISLAVDSAGTLYIGDFNNNDPNNPVGTIFTIAAGGTSPTVLNTGLPATIIPAALALDSAKDLYIADNNQPGGIYKLKPGGTAATVTAGQFTFNQPSGVTLDKAGNLFILSLLGNGTSPIAGQQVVVVPAASPTTPYILPNTGLGASSSMAFDPQGNLNVVDSADGEVFQFAYNTPINMGIALPSFMVFGPNILFNFEFNVPRTLQGFSVVTQGDPSSELTQVPGSCVLGRHSTVDGLPVTNYVPYICNETYSGTPTFPGLRTGAIQAKGTGTTILASVPVYQTGFLGASVTYPLTATVTATGLKQPQALAFSGLDKTLYIADTVASGTGAQGFVYSTNGPAGTALTPVSTGREPLVAPSALAVDGAGNLFIADFERGDVIKVPPPGTGLAATAVNTGGLLQHPIALAFDFLGDLYIGDAGPGGIDAGSGNPGFLVEVPIGGSPFKVTIPGVSIVFPQSLATDPLTADLYIGDGGDPSGVGQVVHLTQDLTSADIYPVNNVTNPTGLAFDPADDLYVLDGNLDTITVVAGAQVGTQTTLPFNNATLSAASALAISAGGQSFVISNIGAGSNNNLLFLNGNAATLAFGNVAVGSQSPSMTATVNSIGNLDLTLQSPYFTTSGTNAAFSVLGSSTCGDGAVLSPSVTCTINMQFKPSTSGPASQSLSVQSDGYNSGKTTLTATGTGGATGNFRRERKRRRR